MEPASGIVEVSTPGDRILWDVMEEYVDETEFALERFDAALDDPEYNLQELAEGPEQKILACIDGLVIGGPLVVDRLLVPEIENADPEEPARTVAVALALLASGRRDLVARCLSHSSAQVHAAAARACGLADSPKLEDWLVDRLRSATTSAERASILEAIAARGLRLDSLSASLKSDDILEVVAAARVAKFADPRAHLGAIQSLVLQGDPELRDAALIAALHFGSLECWNQCERLALDPADAQPTAMELYAALGGPAQHERLAEVLSLDTHRGPALRALGFSGNPAFVDRLLPYLQEGADPLEAKLAAEAISLIAGLDLRDDAFIVEHPSEEEAAEDDEDALPALDDDLEADLSLKPEDALPTPDPHAIHAWWEAEAPKLDKARRHLAGKPWSPAAIADYLEHGALRNRHMVALSLSTRTGGGVCVDTRAFSQRQRAQLHGLASLERTRFIRSYSQW